MKHKLAVFAMTLALMAADSAIAFAVDPVLTLPESLTTIQANAFAGINGDDAFTSVIMGSQVTSIGSGAFSGCKSLSSIKLGINVDSIGDSAFANTAVTEMTFGSSVQSLGSKSFQNCKDLRKVTFKNPDILIVADAFDGCSEVVAYCKTESEVWNFVKDNNSFVVPAFHALLVGQNDYNSATAPALKGCVEDAEQMAAMLQKMDVTQFDTTVIKNKSITEIKEAIANMKDAKDSDITLFYYAGHGDRGGKLVGIDYGDSSIEGEKTITPNELKECLDEIPGEKVIIIDACYSGSLIARGDGEETEDEDDFLPAFLEAFCLTSRSGELATDHYHVLVSSGKYGVSYSNKTSSGTSYGIFTYRLMEGAGFNRLGTVLKNEEAPADTDENGELTIKELYSYVYDKTKNLQTPSYYSADPNWLLFIP